jgi:hypothetical protein
VRTLLMCSACIPVIAALAHRSVIPLADVSLIGMLHRVTFEHPPIS